MRQQRPRSLRIVDGIGRERSPQDGAGGTNRGGGHAPGGFEPAALREGRVEEEERRRSGERRRRQRTLEVQREQLSDFLREDVVVLVTRRARLSREREAGFESEVEVGHKVALRFQALEVDALGEQIEAVFRFLGLGSNPQSEEKREDQAEPERGAEGARGSGTRSPHAAPERNSGGSVAHGGDEASKEAAGAARDGQSSGLRVSCEYAL